MIEAHLTKATLFRKEFGQQHKVSTSVSLLLQAYVTLLVAIEQKDTLLLYDIQASPRNAWIKRH